VSNAYTGGTVINGSTVNTTGAAAAITIIPSAGGLTINNEAVTMSAAAQIDPATAITINGGGVLTLASGNNILNGAITFNNTGGTTTPEIKTGSIILGNNITATNDSFSTFPTISSPIDLNNGSRTITTNGLSPLSLVISGIISNSGASASSQPIIKEGNGILSLTGANTFTGGITVNNGGLLLGANSTQTGTLYIK
jgi:autotransporter-associated beta strand protein